MQQTGSSGARPDWYDRSPIHSLYTMANTFVPHATAERLIHTVSSDKSARVVLGNLSAIRRTAAAPVGNWEAYYSIEPGGAGEVIIQRLSSFDNTVNGRVDVGAMPELFVPPNTVIRLYTDDGSTGGSVYYHGSFHVFEFTT